MPKQDDGRERATAERDQRAEIGVGGDQHAILIDCGVKNDRVLGSLKPEGPNMLGVVPSSCEKRGDVRR